MTIRVGYFVGSLSSTSINRQLAGALLKIAPHNLQFTEIKIGDLPLYSPDFDNDYPPAGRALKDAIAAMQAVLFVTPEYNRSIPGALKNAIDWASRPWGDNSFTNMPAAIVGGSPGKIGTALAQADLRNVLAFCNARQMSSPEAYVQLTPGLIAADGTITDEGTRRFLANFMSEFDIFIRHVLTVLPREAD